MSTTTKATKAALVAAYRARIDATKADWVKPQSVECLMARVRDTLTKGKTPTFHREGEAWRGALADVGLVASTSLRTLRALPDGEGWA